jgi:hypothetical protein
MRALTLTSVNGQTRQAAPPAGWPARLAAWWERRRAAREALDDVPEAAGEETPREKRERQMREMLKNTLDDGGF